MDLKQVKLMAQDETYPFDIDYMPEEYCRKAENELNETAANGSRAMLELKLMLCNEKSIQEIHFNEDFLRQFLRQNKYDVPKTFKRVLSFVTFRRNNSEFFQNLNMETMANVSDCRMCTVLPWRCGEGCTILLFEMSKWFPENLSIDDVLRLSVLMYHQALRNPLSQINGFKVICDYKDASLHLLKCMSPKMLYASYQAILDCTPARNKEFHIVNESLPLTTMWAIFKHFLSDKLRKRFVFHKSPQDLLNYFPKHALPVQYGGDLQNYYMGDWMQRANVQQGHSTIQGQNNFF